MKTRLLVLLLLVVTNHLTAADKPVTVTTVKKSTLTIGNGSFALVKGTKLEVVSRDGDMLIVKYRSSQGKITVADTDLPVDVAIPDPVPTVPAAPPVAPAPKPSVAATPATAPAKSTPPALSVDGKPTSHYGKAVQKAKQATEAHKGTHVDPTKDILDEEPKK